MIQMLQFTCENLAVFSVGFAFPRIDERLDEVDALYLQRGEKTGGGGACARNLGVCAWLRDAALFEVFEVFEVYRM